jgi:prepilin-type N-terminal cleavage/methylation domain-containing protein/prepilin-type processing-associated H-X9-DG protein
MLVQHPQRPARNAFTLVELLVVIGIIALLISLLMPALNKAREAAQIVQCASNMRQVGIAIINYAQVNKGWLPSGRLDHPTSFWTGAGAGLNLELWAHKLVDGKYVTKGPANDYSNRMRSAVFNCPAGFWQGAGGYKPSRELFGWEPRPNGAMLKTAADVKRWQVKPLTRLRPPADYILLAEGKVLNQYHFGFQRINGNGHANDGWLFPHKKGKLINILLADGHVQTGTYKGNGLAPLGGTTNSAFFLNESLVDPDTRRLKWGAP